MCGVRSVKAGRTCMRASVRVNGARHIPRSKPLPSPAQDLVRTQAPTRSSPSTLHTHCIRVVREGTREGLRCAGLFCTSLLAGLACPTLPPDAALGCLAFARLLVEGPVLPLVLGRAVVHQAAQPAALERRAGAGVGALAHRTDLHLQARPKGRGDRAGECRAEH